MSAKRADRVLIGIPGDLGNLLRERARAGYRPVSNEAVMLIKRGLAAEKTASEHTA